VANLYRGFESLPLRHTVWSAEKSASCSPVIAGNPRQFASFHCQKEQRKSLVLAFHLNTQPVFSDGKTSSPVSAVLFGE